MNNTWLSQTEHGQVLQAMNYWKAHWDWECPALFGIELQELEEVMESWPSANLERREKQALAVIGALRELLYGASAPQRAKLPAILGCDYDAAKKLCTKVYSLFRSE